MDHFINDKILYENILISDIFRRYKFLDQFKADVRYYFEHTIMEGETPQMISNEYYETADYWWMILLFNEIEDPFFDWPLTYPEIEEYATKLAAGNSSLRATKINDLQDENDAKRRIKILKREYVPIVLEQLQGGL